ncbi:MAG: M48 family metallopeptidase [Oligoflexus sp.]
MDFFAYQEQAKRNTKLLIFLYVCSVIAIVLTIMALVHFTFPQVLLKNMRGREGQNTLYFADFQGWINWADWSSIILLAGGITGFILIASFIRSQQLHAGGGKRVAVSLGGRQVLPATTNLKEKQLYNVVEEMALASGITVPEIYLLDHDHTINAFAAGVSINHAVIGITRGALENLSRDELQGVIAHEYSHIVHGDMKLNIQLIGILFGILCFQHAGYYIMRGSTGGRRRSKNTGILALLGLGLFLIGAIGYFFGSLIKAAVSRQREYLADAAAVQYTRNPLGISSALQKIETLGSRIANSQAREYSHMFFANGIRSLLATHPPLPKRIQRLSGQSISQTRSAQTQSSAAANHHPAISNLSSQSSAKSNEDTNPNIIDQVGETRFEYIHDASQFLSNLPTNIIAAIHDKNRVAIAVYATFLSGLDLDALPPDLELMVAIGETAWQEARHLAVDIKTIGPKARLPLIELSIPLLRFHSQQELESLMQRIRQTVLADKKIELFEYSLFAVLRYNLFAGRAAKGKRTHKMSQKEAASLVLTAIASTGHESRDKQQMAYIQGAKILQLRGNELFPMASWEVQAFDQALKILDFLPPLSKKRFLQACAEVVSHDHVIKAEEMEVLRAIAAVLQCPIPPILLA